MEATTTSERVANFTFRVRRVMVKVAIAAGGIFGTLVPERESLEV